MSEGAKGGEFFTSTSIVKLIVDVIEPVHGRIFDPACANRPPLRSASPATTTRLRLSLSPGLVFIPLNAYRCH